jgi:hypothetical protein
MPSIQFDFDGAIRCGGCKGLTGFHPPMRCSYYGHRWPCDCGYSYEEEVTRCWFWPHIALEAQEFVITLAQRYAVNEGGTGTVTA